VKLLLLFSADGLHCFVGVTFTWGLRKEPGGEAEATHLYIKVSNTTAQPFSSHMMGEDIVPAVIKEVEAEWSARLDEEE
jgi:hypothetical protein